ncbi:acyl-CoA thioesterase [Mangrovimicrobium sediminis]|uniref:Acyl-CoA thioesterase n=1 Tax=Mangrovimicrobium sediminis TaxID=2562682 RepID=A0A4Z0LZK8_9GAMM|nr:acyl-CoA thioesterase [Haliea sp. SAOS-164]TGD72664.1 acyl-CoA thioesterase [Haliea sp. SAOS-164]
MPDLSVAEVELEIPFHDVDSYRVVWHGNYPKYFEIARCRLLDQLHINYADMEAMGYFFPVIEMDLKYLRPIVFGQRVKVSAKLEEWRNKLVITYRIRDIDSGETLTKGSTSQVAVSPQGVIQYDAPDALVASVERVLGAR